MALPACFALAERVFPRVRAEAARQLCGDGWSQTRVAKALGVSQAMVSKYAAATDNEQDALVLRLASDVVRDANGTDTDGGSWCAALAPADDEPLRDLLAAEAALRKAAPVHLIPQIGMNIARAPADAQTPAHVLAYPARIVAAGNQLVPPVAPAYGGSNHLAQVLLALRQTAPQYHAIANVRAAAFVLAGLPADTVSRCDRGDDTTDAPVFAAARRGLPFIHDPGALGIEPGLYVAATTALELAQTLLTLRNP